MKKSILLTAIFMSLFLVGCGNEKQLVQCYDGQGNFVISNNAYISSGNVTIIDKSGKYKNISYPKENCQNVIFTNKLK